MWCYHWHTIKVTSVSLAYCLDQEPEGMGPNTGTFKLKRGRHPALGVQTEERALGKASKRGTGSLGWTWWLQAPKRQSTELSRGVAKGTGPTSGFSLLYNEVSSVTTCLFSTRGNRIIPQEDLLLCILNFVTNFFFFFLTGGREAREGRDPIYSNYSFHSPSSFII